MNKFRDTKGFTLLELVIVLGLVIVLLSILWNIVALFSSTQTRGTRQVEQSQLVRSLAQLLEEDLRSAIQDPIHPQLEALDGDDDIRRFGLNGSSTAIRIDVIQINPFAIPTDPKPRQAQFGEILQPEIKVPELKTIYYDFTRNAGLSRRELDFETTDPGNSGPEGSNLFAPEIIECRFRYFDGKNWTDSWDSISRSGLPVAIEASLRSLSLAEAAKLRRGSLAEEPLDSAIKRLELNVGVLSRIVAYLPASPVRKFEQYERKKPAKKSDELSVQAPPPPPPPPPPEPTPTGEIPGTPSESSGPLKSWIRGKTDE